MSGNTSHETSWADQWDYNPDPAVYHDKSSGRDDSTAKYKQKVGEGFGKTKQAASTGIKKVKEGTSVGYNWIKDKCQKTTQKH
ncbi:hypothetical protein DKX38_022668 [Salix brachista]|uniref:Uncharacterized protein n=1 Tax=Salix brachista TaxID=2182728 RepID=A0A5N5K051_9ROSI|nr:hypothetical protein DKX38_022668 [Salix brachista]